jgi:hypothetical protein
MKPIKLKGLLKEEKQPINEALDDLDVNLPTAVNRFLEKLTAQLKTYNLPRKKEVLVIAKIIDGLNMDKQEVMRAIQKIKQADAFGGQKKNDVGAGFQGNTKGDGMSGFRGENISEKAPEGWEGINEAPKNVKNVPVKKVGDIVRLRGKTSMADSGIENDKFKIKKVDFRHDSKTGEKYPIYFAASSWYDGRNGSDIKNKSSMYYIDIY